MCSNSTYSGSDLASGFQHEKVTNYIHDDIAFSILSKLPIKSLKRFECVRKSWSQLSEDSRFMTMYSNNLLSQPYDGDTSLLVNLYSESRVWHFLSGKRFENRVNINCPVEYPHRPAMIGFASVNGILCLQNRPDKTLTLWNPTTDEFKVIPPCHVLSPPIVHHFKAAVQFVPSINIHGFGYDSVADDYKLICLLRFIPHFFSNVVPMKDRLLLRDKSLQPFWLIYSLRSNSWKKLHVDMPYSETPLVCLSHGNLRVYMDGVCHWLSKPKSIYAGIGCMVSFDLNNETFFVTPIPSYVTLTWTQLMVLNDSIALLSLPEDTQTFHISILGEVGVEESWIKLFTVEKPWTGYPIEVGMNGEIVFANEDNELFLFDLNTKEIIELGHKRLGKHNRIQIKVYKKSLLPIKRPFII